MARMDFRRELAIYLLTAVLSTASTVGSDWTTKCPVSCKCVWSHGKKSVDCDDARFTAVPNSLSSEIQVLSLRNNDLHSLPNSTFTSVKLVHLHKVYLTRCQIELVDKDALAGMKVLIEIDLSFNKIRHLHRDLFKDCERIREVKITNNPIVKLENGLFHSLIYLQIVDFSECHLEEMGPRLFHNVSSLSKLQLKGNRLTNIPLETIANLTALKDLSLSDNPWNCDCKLRQLRNWVYSKRLYSLPTRCALPESLSGKDWNEITDPNKFACKPEIVALLETATNVLACLVTGDPIPEVSWTVNNKSISNYSYSGSEYLLHETRTATHKWNNLTLRNARARDSGEYKCHAESSGIRQDKSIRLRFDQYVDNTYIASATSNLDVTTVVVSVVLSALLLLLVVFVACCCFCKKRNSNGSKKNKEGANGAVSQMLDSEEKSLINTINPIQKPPRRHDSSLNNSETELHDSNASQYKENGSVSGSAAAESKEHSIGSAATLPRGRSAFENCDSEFCPPDLLSFPGKSNQASPVENASYELSRPPKVLNSPPYAGQFGTLPYSRSHSPFAPSLTVIPRHSGYVTIPRRPRAPSWSSSLSPVFFSPGESVKAEPIYDRLGPRTTADGSSVLSLNKCETPVPYKSRPLPQTPTEPKRFYEPINELASFSPIAKKGNLVHRSNPTIDKIQRETSTPNGKRQSWARITPEGAQIHSTDETESLISPGTTNPNIICKKIPPNPPPKPKKRLGKSSLYEDEGEDGTEV